MKLFENNAVLFLIFNACTEFNDTFPNSEKEKERIREVSGLLSPFSERLNVDGI